VAQTRSLLCVVIALALATFAFVGCGSDSGSDKRAKPEELRQARADARRQTQQEERLKELERRLREGQGPGSRTSGSPGVAVPVPPVAPVVNPRPVSCGSRLFVSSHTTCLFGLNVRDAYYRGHAGRRDDATVRAYSPATKQTHSMRCSGSQPHVCNGANNASVSFDP